MILKIANIFSLLLAEAWLISSPDWEPAILFITLLGTLLTQEIKNSNKEPVNNITEHDKILFAKLLNKLPSTNGGIEFIRDFDFGNSFPSTKLDNLYEFDATWNNAESEFNNINIEKSKKEFLEKLKQFLHNVGQYTSPGYNHWLTVIPNKYRINDFNIPKEVLEEIKLLNDSATLVYEAHQDLIRISKKEIQT
jgi:hypothetical protein